MGNHFSFKKAVAHTAVVVALGLGGSSLYAASNVTGSVSGDVTSNSQDLNNVTIQIFSESTGFSREVTTNTDGSFKFPALPVGSYVLKASKDGFNTFEGTVRVTIGGSVDTDINMTEEGTETMVITGGRMALVDTSSSEAALNISEVEIDRLPVERDTTSVAMLAPGTVQGDSAFGNLASFGGASVAENAYYINGLNVTNFRNGLGGSTVPFEFYEEFQVKTGGYSAEFGRSLGGVVNAVTKSGSNEFEWGFNVFHEPDSLREDLYTTYQPDGSINVYREATDISTTEASIWASGAIIEDELFIFALYNPRDVKNNRATSGGADYTKSSNDDAFWGTRVDWYITNDHWLELTAFSDKRTNTADVFDFDVNTHEVGASQGQQQAFRGGKNWSLRYTGLLSDNFTMKALFGKNEYDLTTQSSTDDCPIIVDVFTGLTGPGVNYAGCWVSATVETGKDEREVARVDFEYFLDNHELRFGLDNETLTSEGTLQYSGGIYHRYDLFAPGTELRNNALVPDANGDGSDVAVVTDRVFRNGGLFETDSTALYVEDLWSVTDNFTASLGLRFERFKNKNPDGNAFIDIDNQIAPRIGLVYDLFGDGQSKIYANWGRYHLPVANNTNVRLAGAEFDVSNYYVLEGVNADDTPIYGDQIGGSREVSNGEIPDAETVRDANIDPMYQDELILGYQTRFADDWTLGIKYTERDLARHIDDVVIDHALDELGVNYDTSHNHYVLTNPGQDMSVLVDTDLDGAGDTRVDIPAELLGYPEAKREYNAVDVIFERRWKGDWSFRGTYTYSESKGNVEGYVKSDNGQDDAGITQDFDFPELMDGAYGYLPNDRRHSFKLNGAYAITDNLTTSANYTLLSGRPLNAFGVGHPNGVPSYGDTFYNQVNGEYVQRPRGTAGRTPWTNRLDLGLQYAMQPTEGVDLNIRLDIFNVYNEEEPTEFNEFAEDGLGSSNPRYLQRQSFQTPRYVRIGFEANF